MNGFAATDLISGERRRAGAEPPPARVFRRPIRPVPVGTEELVLLGQAAGRGPWLSGRANTGNVEAVSVVKELNGRNIFGASQAETVSPDEALKWGVDVSLYHFAPQYREGFDSSRPFAGTIRYAAPQYLADKDFINHARAAIGAARYAVGKPKSADVRDPRWGGHRSRSSAMMPGAYEDPIRAAMGV